MLRNVLFTSMRGLSLGQHTVPVTRPFLVGLSMRYKSTLTKEEKQRIQEEIRYLRQTTYIPPAPSRGTSGWMVYIKEQLPNVKKENPRTTIFQLSSIISKSWKELSDAEKKTYVDEAARKTAEMQKEYDRWYKSLSSEQISVYNRIVALENKAGARKSFLKDPNPPKHPLSSYLRFCKDVRKTLPKGLSFTEQAKELGRMWAELPQSEKDAYEVATAKEMKEYWEKKLEKLESKRA
jgi:hypothetical protein